MDTSCYFQAPGSAEASRRDSRPNEDCFDSTPIFSNKNIEEVNFQIGVDDDEPNDCVAIRMSTYHQQDENSALVFHSHIGCYLNWRDVRTVRDYLNFLLANAPSDKRGEAI